MRMPELKALAREHRLRGYSQLRKAELIDLLQDNEHQALRRPHPNRPPLPSPQRSAVPTLQMSPSRVPPRGTTWELQRELQTKDSGPLVGHPDGRQPELETPLTKRQLKHRRNKDSKLTKKFVSLDAEISNPKFQMDTLKDEIMRAFKSTNAGFKRKKIRSMKREANKIAEKLKESEKALELVEPRVPKDPSAESPLNYILRIGLNL